MEDRTPVNSGSANIDAGRLRLWRFALAVASSVIVILVIWLVLFCHHAQTDNLYNLGMVRRSASGDVWPLLETSYTHWYFKAYPQVRPEDWHRSAPFVILALLGRVLGTEHVTILSIPHLLWVLAWFAVAYRLFRRIQSRDPPDRPSGLSCWFSVLLLVVILVGSRPGLFSLSASFMDDVPAAVCALVVSAFCCASVRGFPTPPSSGSAWAWRSG
jgi:hypothetical protein